MARIVVRAFMPNGELRKSRDIDRRFEQDEPVYAGNQAPRHDGNQVGRQQDFGEDQEAGYRYRDMSTSPDARQHVVRHAPEALASKGDEGMIQGAEAVDRERPRRRIGMIGAERADVALVSFKIGRAHV